MRVRLDLFFDYVYDFTRYLLSSGLFSQTSDAQARAQGEIIREYHRIEKGLLNPNPRPFGNDFRDDLIKRTTLYLEQYGLDPQVLSAVSNLQHYVQFHDAIGEGLPDSVVTSVAELVAAVGEEAVYSVSAGVDTVLRKDIEALQRIDYESFVSCRRSVREFSGKPVSIECIINAVRAVRYTPSVCNRQTCNVNLYTVKDDILRILSHQNGNDTFRDEVNTLLVVSSHLSYFNRIGEKNQAYIDGGLFAMNLVLALHAQGLGTCMLNWSRDRRYDKQLKKLLGFQRHRVIIMMIAVGSLKEDYRVAASVKRSVDELLDIDSPLRG